MYHGDMVALQIRDVPDEVRAALAAKASRQGQSLQGLLLDIVVREAGFENNIALIDEISEWPTRGAFTGDDVVAALEAGRPQG